MNLPHALHVLAAALWVGGMFFAYVCLRPAAAILEPPQRLQLWSAVLQRFFRWVGAAVAILLATGFWMFFQGLRGMHVHLMMGLGIAMMLLAGHVYFAPLRRLHGYAAAGNWPEAAAQLNQIRRFIGINLSLGLLVLGIAGAAA